MSGVSLICFAGSYTIALVLELSRLLFRSGVRHALILAVTAAGLAAHSAFLYYRVVEAAGAPLSSQRDWYLLAAWALGATYLYLAYYHPLKSFGPFLLPLVLGLLLTARFFADATPFAPEPASKVWGLIHGMSILLAVVAVLVGFAAGLMYFEQARRLKRKLPPIRGLRLPSLEWLERVNQRSLVIAVLMLAVGVASGMVLNLVRASDSGGRLPWHDPIVLSTLVTLAWLLLALVITGFYRPARQSHRVVYITVVSFLFLLVALGVGLFVQSQHSAGRRAAAVQVRSPLGDPHRAAAGGVFARASVGDFA